MIPGFSDGLNGGVTVPRGNWVRCTAVNETATLQLRKIVNNTHGGTAVSSDFTLTATPTGPDVPAGLEPMTVTGSEVYPILRGPPERRVRHHRNRSPGLPARIRHLRGDVGPAARRIGRRATAAEGSCT